MTIGIDEFDKRVTPFPGGRAYCQICGEALIAKCGEIYSWHWAHRNDRDCDPWKEHETEWHRVWKSRFPEAWREIPIINENGEKHIADVRTKEDLVIEFQNCSISPATVRIREEFYDNIIWVINAESFKKNFKLASVVKRKLRQLDASAADPYIPEEEEYQEEIEDLTKQLQEIENKIRPTVERIRGDQSRIETLNGYLGNIDDLTSKILDTWYSDSYLEYDLRKLVKGLDNEYEKRIRELKKQTTELKEKISKHANNIKVIRALEDIEVEGKPYKVAAFHHISLQNYKLFTLIEKESRRTFFPSIRKIKDDFDYHRLKYNHENFDFVFDPTENIDYHENAIARLNDALLLLKSYIPENRYLLRDTLLSNINLLVKSAEKRTEENEHAWDVLLEEQGELEFAKGKKEMEMKDVVERAKGQKLEEIKNNRFSVMRDKKGLYYFRWKHERTTWQHAVASIFFDTGEGFLFRKTSDGVVSKISLSEFLAHHGGVSLTKEDHVARMRS